MTLRRWSAERRHRLPPGGFAGSRFLQSAPAPLSCPRGPGAPSRGSTGSRTGRVPVPRAGQGRAGAASSGSRRGHGQHAQAGHLRASPALLRARRSPRVRALHTFRDRALIGGVLPVTLAGSLPIGRPVATTVGLRGSRFTRSAPPLGAAAPLRPHRGPPSEAAAGAYGPRPGRRRDSRGGERSRGAPAVAPPAAPQHRCFKRWLRGARSSTRPGEGARRLAGRPPGGHGPHRKESKSILNQLKWGISILNCIQSSHLKRGPQSCMKQQFELICRHLKSETDSIFNRLNMPDPSHGTHVFGSLSASNCSQITRSQVRGGNLLVCDCCAWLERPERLYHGMTRLSLLPAPWYKCARECLIPNKDQGTLDSKWPRSQDSK
ncbi:uncharacterized protein GJ701_014042 isoform 1-T2 [Geothlypis trichas]